MPWYVRGDPPQIQNPWNLVATAPACLPPPPINIVYGPYWAENILVTISIQVYSNVQAGLKRMLEKTRLIQLGSKNFLLAASY